jgi:hypothetical protein
MRVQMLVALVWCERMFVGYGLCLSKIRKDLSGNELYCSTSLLRCPPSDDRSPRHWSSHRDSSRPPRQDNRIFKAHHIGANSKLIQRFKTFSNKGNKSVYDVAGAVLDQELEGLVNLATELKDSTITWLQKFHPELLIG